MRITPTDYIEAKPNAVHRKYLTKYTSFYYRFYLTLHGKAPEITATWKAVPRGKSVTAACLLKVQ